MNRYVADQFIHKGLPSASPFFRPGALDTVDEFHNGHYRETNLDLAVSCLELFEDLSNRVTSPLTGDHHAGIEN